MPKKHKGAVDELFRSKKPVMTVSSFMKSIHADWFESLLSFMSLAVACPICLDAGVPDSLFLRTILIFMHFGLVACVKKCPQCKAPVVLGYRKCNKTYQFQCSKNQMHFRESPQALGALTKVTSSGWPAFLLVILLMHLDFNWSTVVNEISKACGTVDPNTLMNYRRYVQMALRGYLLAKNLMRIGGSDITAVLDETIIGVRQGVRSKKTQGVTQEKAKNGKVKPRKQWRKGLHIAKRLPAQTIWKKPAAAKKPASAVAKRPASVDRRSDSWWLWVAVTVGKGKSRFTHANGKKRVTFHLLPRPEDAPAGKPRGTESLMKVLKTHLKVKSRLVYDKWTGTVAAVRRLGFRHAPPVNHSIAFRDRKSGFHSNDVESENNRTKRFLRKRYGVLNLGKHKNLNNDTILDMYEYVYRVNVASTFAGYMKAMAIANFNDHKALEDI